MSMTQCQGGIDDTSELQAESFLQERERLAMKGQAKTGFDIMQTCYVSSFLLDAS